MAQSLQRKLLEKSVDRKAESLMEPLLGTDDGSTRSSQSAASSFTNAKPTASQMLTKVAVYVGAAVGAATWVGGIITFPAIAVYIGAGIFITNAPYAAYKEETIAKLPTLRNLNNKLREDANDLSENVDALAEEIDTLEPEAQRVDEIEEDLRIICAQQRVNVDKFVDLVKENQSILDQMKENLRQRIAQDVMRIVIQSDNNNDGSFDKVEIKMLGFKIRLQLQEYGVVFDESKFFKLLGSTPSVEGTIQIVSNLFSSKASSDDSDLDEDDGGSHDIFLMAGNNATASGSLSDESAVKRPSFVGVKDMSLSVKKKIKQSELYLTPDESARRLSARALAARRLEKEAEGTIPELKKLQQASATSARKKSERKKIKRLLSKPFR